MNRFLSSSLRASGRTLFYSTLPTPNTPPPNPSGTSGQQQPPDPSTTQPKSTFDAPQPETPPKTNFGLFERINRKILQDAVEASGTKPNPETERTTLLTRMDAKIQKEIQELKAAEMKKKEEGKRSRLNATTERIQQRMDDFFDLEKNASERERLMNIAIHDGHWNDQKEVVRVGVKLWEAPQKMTPPSHAPRIPLIEGNNLLRERVDSVSLVSNYKVSLVTFVFAAFGEPHVKSYMDPFMEQFKDNKDVGIIQFNIEETWTKTWALKLFAPLIRWRTPKEMQTNYVIHTGEIKDLRRSVGMTNKLLGWVNLIDHKGRIRWQAHGPAKEHEINTLINSCRTLLESAPTPAPAVKPQPTPIPSSIPSSIPSK